MADEAPTAPQTTAATTAPAATAAAPAPAADAPAAPAASTETPASVTPLAAKAPEAPAQAAPDAAKTPAPTLLSEEPKAKTDAPAGDKPAANPEAPAEAPKADEAKKDEAPKEGEPKKEEGSQSDKPAPQPTYEPFKLEDGFAVDDTKLGEFTGVLAEVELAKGDHGKVQEAGQKLVDRHIAEVKNVLQRQNEFYLNAFEQQKSDWFSALQKDPDIGGEKMDATVESARQFISQYGGTVEQQKSVRDLMLKTGVGNHPDLVRLLATAMKSMTKEGSPVPAQNLNTAPKSKVERRYGKMS